MKQIFNDILPYDTLDSFDSHECYGIKVNYCVYYSVCIIIYDDKACVFQGFYQSMLC